MQCRIFASGSRFDITGGAVELFVSCADPFACSDPDSFNSCLHGIKLVIPNHGSSHLQGTDSAD